MVLVTHYYSSSRIQALLMQPKHTSHQKSNLRACFRCGKLQTHRRHRLQDCSAPVGASQILEYQSPNNNRSESNVAYYRSRQQSDPALVNDNTHHFKKKMEIVQKTAILSRPCTDLPVTAEQLQSHLLELEVWSNKISRL